MHMHTQGPASGVPILACRSLEGTETSWQAPGEPTKASINEYAALNCKRLLDMIYMLHISLYVIIWALHASLCMVSPYGTRKAAMCMCVYIYIYIYICIYIYVYAYIYIYMKSQQSSCLSFGLLTPGVFQVVVREV